ncbi:hypothetical protein GGR44_001062 [Sphingobium fontiphilum]|uniref:Uncharacterized protein n=1 Tax=Sphingobium fontiphilum TaxID=944425 RepID=A0A7W6DDT6_9SPHN|nr:hypothetical protein [Sphingobium fontiphilum]MBB3981415.1 hypothetical protein [Sphingobium fontiphilum]
MMPPVAIVQAEPEQTISGTVQAGVVCPLLHLSDGRVFALQGVNRKDAPVGASVTVVGRPIMMSTCQQGPAFLVARIITPSSSS